jgi:hypothetical protein
MADEEMCGRWGSREFWRPYIKERDETFSCLLLFFWKGSCMPHINVRIRGPYTESNRTEVKECLVDATHRTEREEEKWKPTILFLLLSPITARSRKNRNTVFFIIIIFKLAFYFFSLRVTCTCTSFADSHTKSPSAWDNRCYSWNSDTWNIPFFLFRIK